MTSITPELTEELKNHFGDSPKVGILPAFRVNTFSELVRHTAKLSYRNKNYCLFFRGQDDDYKNKAGTSTFYPSIYRGYSPLSELTNRFDILNGAGEALAELFQQRKIEGAREVKRRKSIQWSILQHYEVCATPFLDFTHSLRVACSFATYNKKNDYGYVFVFGLPFQTNRISINSEEDIINVRLLSICPPTAYRPYFQEGYMVGTDDITTNFETKSELDFNNRLIAKFEIRNTNSFWGDGFHKIPSGSLYPPNDPIFELCQEIKEKTEKGLKSGDLGDFLKSWTVLEEGVILLARKETQRYLSMREAIRALYERKLIKEEQLYELDRLRKFRNTLVHKPQKVKPSEVKDFLNILETIKRSFS